LWSYPSRITWTKNLERQDGTLGIQYWTIDGQSGILSSHESDLLERISRELRLDGTHILNCDEIMKECGNRYAMWLVERNVLSILKEWQARFPEVA
jgi:hypothetical protein